MPHSNLAASSRLGTQLSEIMSSAPQVIALRLARLASAGAAPDAQDCDEFYRMGTEKFDAGVEAWGAMTMELLAVHQRWTMALLQDCWAPWLGGAATMAPLGLATQWQSDALAVLARGIAPVHRHATANARRLAARPA